MAAAHHFRRPGWRPVFVSYIVLVVVLASTSSAAFFVTRSVQQQGESLMQNAILSVELVDRMGADTARRRLLLEEHINEMTAERMSRTERQLAEVDADYRAAADQYEPLTTFPGEKHLWRVLQHDVANVEEPIAAVVALSRQNRDAEARQALQDIDSRFLPIERGVAALVRINRDAAQVAMARAEALRDWSTIVSSIAFLVQVGLTLLVGVWTTRLVRRREEQTRRYAEMLEWRNQELDAFAGRVAHDLGGPLTTIALAAASVGRRAHEGDKTVAILDRGVDRMRSIIQALLALSRIPESASEKNCNPAAVAALSRDDLAERFAAEAVTLACDVQPARVRCAEDLLRQVLVNLLDNAAKYRCSGATARAELTGRLEQDRYVLELSDNGVGMSPEEVQRAFDRFYRALRVRDQQGTGLGLSIVKRIIEASGGTVTIESTLSHGTTVRICLPVAGAVDRASRERSRADAKNG